MTTKQSVRGWLLVIYTLLLGLVAGWLLIANFPIVKEDGTIVFKDADKPWFWPFGEMRSTGACLLLMAFLSGMAGSFLHGGQSLTTFIGNQSFRCSWTAWYILRPWVGGVLGLAIYVAVRAGLVGPGEASVNPFGVVALGLLGGWFSKVTTDKLKEVFETMLKTDEDDTRRNKVNEKVPLIKTIEPGSIKRAGGSVAVTGMNFQSDIKATVAGEAAEVDFKSDKAIKVRVKGLEKVKEKEVELRLLNPSIAESAITKLKLEGGSK